MKELSVEQKAIAYDEALKVLHKYDGANIMFSQSLKEEMFPELKESEDEKIRKEIIEIVMQPTWKTEKEFRRRNELCTWLEKQGDKDKFIEKELGCIKGYREKAIKRLEELEKQGEKGTNGNEREIPISEQKQDVSMQINSSEYINDMGGNGCYLKNTTQASAWSEEDKNMLQSILDEYKSMPTEKRNWLKALKDRIQSQPKPEWSEEDEETLCRCISATFDHGYLKECNWLKSIRPQNTWKPSDEQMERLKGTINSLPHQEVLYSLYQDLKKLKG